MWYLFFQVKKTFKPLEADLISVISDPEDDVEAGDIKCKFVMCKSKKCSYMNEKFSETAKCSKNAAKRSLNFNPELST